MTRSPTPSAVIDAFRRYGLAASVFIVAAVVTLGSYHEAVDEEMDATRNRFQSQAEERVAHLRDRADSIVLLADILRRQLAFSADERHALFTDIVAPILAHHPEIRHLGTLRIAGDAVQLTASAGRNAGPPLESPEGAGTAAIREAIDVAKAGRRTVATAPYTLAADSGSPRKAIRILGPIVRSDTASEPVGELLFIEVSVEDLLSQSLAASPERSPRPPSALEILDTTDTAHPAQPVHRDSPFHIGEMSFADGVDIADRHWLVVAAADPLAYPMMPSQDAGAQLFSGLSLGALAAFVLYVLQTRADAIRRQVNEKTLALGEANASLEQYVKALGETNRLLESEVDEHARAENLLRETTTLQRAILDCAEYAIVYTDANGIIRVVNPAAERLFGYRADELVGDQTPLLFHTADDIAHWTLSHTASGFAALASEAGSGVLEPREINLRRRNGDIFPANISLSIVRDGNRQIRGYLGIVADITQRRDAEHRIRHLAHYDSLTSLPNRTLLNTHLAEVIAKARLRQRGVAVLFTDLDRFKYVNDTLGHHAGDELLLSVAKRLRACVRDGDLVARTGGDEFVVVLDNLDEDSMPEELAERILASLSRPFELHGRQFTVTLSIGIALYPHDGLDGTALIKNADAAMYLAKERGRNNFQFFDHGLSERYSERLELENRLRHAVEENQLALFYQPQVDTLSGELIGMEALIRWRQPDGSMIPPDKFIPIAEECGLIVPIGAWVLHEACRQNQVWQQEGICRVPIGVNLSARQFDDASLLDTIQSALAQSGLAPAYLDLELTESLVMRNPEHTRSLLAECKKLGLQLSVDDFGTGYSSLSNLKRFPIDRLKIDRSFINDIVTEADDATIAQTIVAMAHTLRLEVIAEGVETEAQLTLLRRWRCDAYQGYLCSRPIGANDMTHMLRTLRATRQVSLAAI